MNIKGKNFLQSLVYLYQKIRLLPHADDAVNACRDIGGNKWVIKAQVHAGGRGKAGGVKLVNTPEEAVEFSNHWLGKRLVTYQTDPKDSW